MRIVLGGVLLAALVPACDVPVFRYALEHWPADSYEALLYHRGPLGAGEGAAAEALERCAGSGLNLRVRRVDVAAGGVAPSGARLPWVVLRAPGSPEAGREIWAGPLAGLPVGRWADSPARREIVRRILSGESAVWIFLESGDRAKDGPAAALLESRLREMERTLKLPGPADEPVSPPLRLAFSVVRVSRGDPAEEMLVRVLLRSEEGLESLRGPMAFPVFGRGRKLEALAGGGISEGNVADYCAFLTGPCSCRVKLQNPGTDLLLSADWEGSLGAGDSARPAPPPAGPAPRPAPPFLFLWVGLAVAAAGTVLSGLFLLRRGRGAGRPHP